MNFDFDYIEIPYLQEVLNLLPMNPDDEEDVATYIQNITVLVSINYKHEQYQFAYFGVHLLFMTYIYCVAWKLSRIEPTRYSDAIIFVRSYSGREQDLKIEGANSIFNYSLMPEKDIAKLFKIMNLDNSCISRVSALIDDRNEMAHASGKFSILTDNIFEVKMKNILSLMSSIQKCLNVLIRKWYCQIVSDFCVGKYENYLDPKDFITEQMVQSFKLSVEELMFCKGISVKNLITSDKNLEYSLENFKLAINDYCENLEF